MARRYYEDFEVGELTEHGERTLQREEILEFAETYDPQAIHTDPEHAGETMYGGLIASGWQTAATVMRLLVEEVLEETVALGARGVDDLRWHRPVYPGDTLSLRAEVVDKRPSESHDDRGYVDHRIEGINQDGEVVISWVGLGIVARRDAD
jgi:acyl dehydratase